MAGYTTHADAVRDVLAGAATQLSHAEGSFLASSPR